MPNLREIAAASVNPTESADPGTFIGGATEASTFASGIVRGLSAQETAQNHAATLAASAAIRQEKREHDTALGEVLGDFVGNQASFLMDSVENEAGLAAKKAESEGVQVGESGAEVLKGADRLGKMEGYLRKTGQMNTLGQIKLLMQQQEYIRLRPDMGEDIIRMTNAASTDANAILAKDEERSEAERAKKLSDEEAFYDGVLKANNQADPQASFADKRKVALQLQWADAGRQAAARELAELEQNDKVASIRDNGDQRALARRERATKQASLDVMQSSLLPTTTLAAGDEARRIASSGAPVQERVMEWNNYLAGVDANTTAAIKDPELRAKAITQIRQSLAPYADYVAGKARAEGALAEQHATEAEAMGRIYNASGPADVEKIVFARDAAPVLTQLLGRAQADESYANTYTALFTRVGLLDPNAPKQNIKGITSPADMRKKLPLQGAGSPYTLPKQEPRDVTDKQVKATTQQLVNVVRTVGRMDTSLPTGKKAAAVAVVSGFTDPVVVNDSGNVKDMMYGLAGDPKIANAFADNPHATLAREAYLGQARAYFTGVKADVQKQMGKPLDDLVEGAINPDGTVVFTAKEGAYVFPSMVTQLNADGNAAVRAWAHLNGRTLDKAAAKEFFSK